MQVDVSLASVGAALRRAAQQARLVAKRTGTPLVFEQDGIIQKRWFKDEPLSAVRDEVVDYKTGRPSSGNENSR